MAGGASVLVNTGDGFTTSKTLNNELLQPLADTVYT
jgi:hypothetical protein